MSTEVTTTTGAQVTPAPTLDPEILERLVIGGDLSRLSSADKIRYYGTLCESLGLNPAAQPFQYMRFQGKEILYATRAAAEQLRARHRVSLTITDRREVGDVYVVTARATLPDGRTDESTGAVPLTRSWTDEKTGRRQSAPLEGEDLANAFMKCETKAKRRVTLSVCGLGTLVEGEEDTMRGAQVVEIDYQTGEVVDPPTPREPRRDAPPTERVYSDAPRRDDRPSGGAASPARFPGTCSRCGERYDEGDPIHFQKRNDGGWDRWHETCPVSQANAPERSDPQAVRQVRALIARLDEAPDRPSIRACGQDLHRALSAALADGRIRPDGETERASRAAMDRAIVRREELREAEAVRGPSQDDPWADDDVIDAEIVGEEAS